MKTRHLMTLTVDVPSVQRLGSVPHGTRVTVPIPNGHFEGERLRGTVVRGGDWTLLRSDGVLELDLRLTLATDSGAFIELWSIGLRHGPPDVIAALARGERVDPQAYYFRTMPRFSTAASEYVFLNRTLAIADGERRAAQVIYTIHELL